MDAPEDFLSAHGTTEHFTPGSGHTATPDDAASSESWPTLIPLSLPALPRLDPRCLPGWAGDFALALAEETETPPELAVGLILATVATAAARRWRLRVRQNHFEPLNLWVAPALPPGNRKSAVQAAVTAPLLAWEKDRAASLEPEIRRAASELRTAEARVKELRAKAARANDDAESKDYARRAADLEADLPEVPRVPLLWTSDVTPERLGILLAEHSERMGWLSSEGGIFDMLAGRYSGGIPNLDLILKAHSGDAERVCRTGRADVFLAHPLLTIGLSPQPDALRGLAGKPGFRGRGLLGRFLFLVPPSPLGYRRLDGKAMPEDVKHAYAAGIRALLDAPANRNEDGTETPYILRLSQGAVTDWLEFARTIEVTMRPGGEFDNATDWAGKCPGAVARIAGVLHLIEHAYTLAPHEIEISAETMGRALALMSVITKHSLHAFDLMGADDTTQGARRLLGWIERNRRPSFPLRDAWQGLKGTFTRMADLNTAAEALEERGYIAVARPEAQGPGRPPSPRVTVRPDIAREW